MPRFNETEPTHLDLHFPKAGVDRADAWGRQPVRQIGGRYQRSCPYAANVRGYDPASGRDRGGSRTGLSKYVATQVNGVTWVVQDLRCLVTTAQLGASVQLSQSGRVVTVFAVSQGVCKVVNPGGTAWTAVTNNSGSTPALNATGVMMSAPNNQKLYIVDGTNFRYYNAATNSIEAWTATSGSLPRDASNNGPRLIATWRGRTVLSGLLKDPHNWFMTKVSDPHNFNYLPPSPVPPDAAVAGNNSPLGLIGDVVTGLAPWTDDVMVVLGDHTIYRMTGDPMAGGQIDLVSDAIGGAWGEAWCKDPAGNLYFFSNRGAVFMMEYPNGAPRRISQPIEPLLRETTTGTYLHRLFWNDHDQGLHVFITKTATVAATTHYFLEARTGAWQPDTFANTSHNPLCGCVVDGNDPEDRAVLLGGWDGYVRKIDPDATTDDGTSIASEVWIGPILSNEYDEMLLNELQAVMGETSGTVTWSVHAGDTAEAAFAASAATSGTWTAGRNYTQPVRRAEHALYIKITAKSPWAMELIRAKFGPRGKVRRRA
jgi:hypothetical protein